ncbi:MAG: class I SAM-dependent methyltransferase [Opitutae bacterium]|nr:class I SAM-dependent methyltransferase [Opitutae bacterium]
MRLSSTRRHWNRFAQTDPLWAILTDPDKKGNRWQVDEFFADGRRIVAAELTRVRAGYPELRTNSALDFGCGVGRLSQALAGHFQSVAGIDLSENMLAHAHRYNQHGARVRYLHNPHPDLRLLPDDTFDFVYSLLTLQHMEPAYALRYIEEFVRVAAPGGAIFFQLPATVTPRRRSFTLWPDTLAWRLWRWTKRKLAIEPVMEMHCIPRAEVEATLHAAGAEILHAYRYDAAGSEIESWGYLARKP